VLNYALRLLYVGIRTTDNLYVTTLVVPSFMGCVACDAILAGFANLRYQLQNTLGTELLLSNQ
jgi:hypothetical protein